MRQRPTARRWWTLLILGLVGAWADAGARPAAGSTCHPPDRPVLGLDLDDTAGGNLRAGLPTDDPAGGAAATRATHPRYRPAPCAPDRGGRPERSSASTLPAGPTPAATPCPSPTPPRRAGDEEPARSLDGEGRLERPPRRI